MVTDKNKKQFEKWYNKQNFHIQFDRLDFSFLDNKNTAHKSLSRSDIIEAYKIAFITLDNY